MYKKLILGASLVSMLAPYGFATGEYFTLPTDFQTNALATITGVVTVLLAIRALPVAWKYLVQFFGKKSA